MQALEQKKFCPTVFLDVTQAFDRVWHEGLLTKLAKILPAKFCHLIKNYLSHRSYQVTYGSATSAVHWINAGVPQGSVLGPTLFLLYTADVPALSSSHIEIATFADDTAILSTSSNHPEASARLQRALNSFVTWARRWKIAINEQKSVHVDFALRDHGLLPITIEGKDIPRRDSARYLGMFLDKKLNYKEHVKTKQTELNLRLQNLYWLLGGRSSVSLANKRLIYLTILKPVWCYGIQLWGCTANSNRLIIQRFQNSVLRIISRAPWFVRNEELHKDLDMATVNETIQGYARRHEQRLHNHSNPLAIQLLDTTQETRRLKRRHPIDLT